MSTITQPRRSVNAKSRPLTAELTLTINGTAYDVTPIAPGPDNTKAFRLVKRCAEETVYDVCQTVTGLVECDCPSYEATYRGNGLETCKHGRALIMVGLLDYPDFDEPADDARAAYDDAREKLARIAEAEDAVRREGEAPAPCCDPAAEPAPCPACAATPATHDGPADLSDDEWDDDHVWTTSDVVGPDDPVDMRTWDPALDAEDDGPATRVARTLGEQIDVEARHYRTLGTAFGDLIAETLERLAAEVRYLDAATPDAYRDRREAALDAARDAAEARMASRCC